MSAENASDDYSVVILRLFEVESGYPVSSKLFGDVGAGIFDFEFYNYNYLLDNVETLEALVEGLEQLSPFADDALEITKTFSVEDFDRFKTDLSEERALSDKADTDSTFPHDWLPILIPSRFIEAQLLSSAARAPLGAALIRIALIERHSKQ